MTVAELIEKLKQMPQEKQVFIESRYFEAFHEDIEIEELEVIPGARRIDAVVIR